MDLLKKLSEADGIAGNEGSIQELVCKELEPLCEEIKVDALGSVIARRGHCTKKAPLKVMLAAHMDEIGFIVSHVDREKGFLRIHPIGGFDPRTLVAQRVRVHCENGPLLGVLGSKPVHIMSEAEKARKPDIKKFYVDLGLPGAEAMKNVDIGDMVTLQRDFTELGETVTGKALDNRAGVYIMIETLRALKKSRLGVEVYAVATVQEEVGLRGAQTSAFGIHPDMAVALDVTVASDVPDAKPHEFISTLGNGIAIKLMDGSVICDKPMVKAFRTIAKDKNIPHQLEILTRGSTDTGPIQRSREGVRVAALSLPTRYLHSTVEMAHKKDLKAGVDLLSQFLKQASKLPTSSTP